MLISGSREIETPNGRRWIGRVSHEIRSALLGAPTRMVTASSTTQRSREHRLCGRAAENLRVEVGDRMPDRPLWLRPMLKFIDPLITNSFAPKTLITWLRSPGSGPVRFGSSEIRSKSELTFASSQGVSGRNRPA